MKKHTTKAQSQIEHAQLHKDVQPLPKAAQARLKPAEPRFCASFNRATFYEYQEDIHKTKGKKPNRAQKQDSMTRLHC